MNVTEVKDFLQRISKDLELTNSLLVDGKSNDVRVVWNVGFVYGQIQGFLKRIELEESSEQNHSDNII